MIISLGGKKKHDSQNRNHPHHHVAPVRALDEQAPHIEDEVQLAGTAVAKIRSHTTFRRSTVPSRYLH